MIFNEEEKFVLRELTKDMNITCKEDLLLAVLEVDAGDYESKILLKKLVNEIKFIYN